MCLGLGPIQISVWREEMLLSGISKQLLVDVSVAATGQQYRLSWQRSSEIDAVEANVKKR